MYRSVVLRLDPGQINLSEHLPYCCDLTPGLDFFGTYPFLSLSECRHAWDLLLHFL